MSVVGLSSCALAACGGSASHAASAPAARGSGVHHGTVPGTASGSTGATGQIASAWLAAQVAFHDAALTADPSAPGLAATMVPPQLPGAQSALAAMRSHGELARGPDYYGTPRVSGVTGTTATVVSCIHDEELVYYAATGQPVPGVLGQPDYELVTSTMARTPTGWKVSDQRVQVGACTGS